MLPVFQFNQGKIMIEPRMKRLIDDFDYFCQEAQVTRDNGAAEIIIDHVGDLPVRLLCFTAFDEWSDFEVLEKGHEHLLRVVSALGIEL